MSSYQKKSQKPQDHTSYNFEAEIPRQDFLSATVAKKECVPSNSFCPALPFVLWSRDSNLDDLPLPCISSLEMLITLFIIPLIAIQDPIFQMKK